MIAIVDYGVGNLFSLRSSLGFLGAQAEVTGDPERIARADKLILPGVGAFGDAAELLHASGLDEVLRQEVRRGKLLLGICLGMQLLFDRSFEYGEHAGLGLLHGDVIGMEGRLPGELKIPHIGWNALRFTAPHPLFRNVEEGSCVYFVHSFYVPETAPDVIATAEYGVNVTAAAARDNVMGCQFHPEKSGSVGMKILRAFCEMEGKA
jgi:glutamine amidotransferase